MSAQAYISIRVSTLPQPSVDSPFDISIANRGAHCAFSSGYRQTLRGHSWELVTWCMSFVAIYFAALGIIRRGLAGSNGPHEGRLIDRMEKMAPTGHLLRARTLFRRYAGFLIGTGASIATGAFGKVITPSWRTAPDPASECSPAELWCGNRRLPRSSGRSSLSDFLKKLMTKLQ